MSIKLMAKVFDSDLPATEKLVLLAMADYASDSGDSIFPSVDTLARKCSLSDRTIRTSIQNLIETNYLIIARHGGGSGNTNLYKIRVSRFTLSDNNGELPSLKGETGSKKGERASPDSSLTINNHQEPVGLFEMPKPRTKEEIMAMTRQALQQGAADYEKRVNEGAAEVQHFPPDVVDVVDRVCRLWRLTPPRTSDNSYAYWVKTARELQAVCGEFGLALLDSLYQMWDASSDENRLTIAGPGSLVNLARAHAAEKRRQDTVPAPETQEVGYHWDSNLTPEENEARMREFMKRNQETNNDTESDPQT